MFNLFKKHTMDQDKAFEALKLDKHITLLDVRTRIEFKSGHIDRSINLPLSELQIKVEKLYPMKDKKFFIVCQSGARAADACHIMKELGYTDVVSIGGVSTWNHGLKH